MRRIFLTGASGFIGSEVIDFALANGDTVKNFDVNPPTDDKAEFWVEGDVRDRTALARAVHEFAPDYIIHLASDTDVQITDLKEFTVTINGTQNVVEVAHEVSELTRFIHISTQFVVRPGVAPPHEEYLEPYTVYGEAKAETERIVRGAELKAPWIIIRPTIIWGPRHPSFRENIFKYIRNRQYLHPVDSQPIMRAFGYVTNTAEQIYKLATADSGALERSVYYVGDQTLDYAVWADGFSVALTGKRARRIPTSLLKVMGAIGDLLKHCRLPAPIDSGRAFRMSTSSQIDLSPTLAVVGPPAIGFHEGLARTVKWLDEPVD